MSINLEVLETQAKKACSIDGTIPPCIFVESEVILALIGRIRELEAERDRWKERWQATVEDATTQRATIQRVRDARSNHPEIPECDRYTDDDPIKCGWKSAVESIDKALEES